VRPAEPDGEPAADGGRAGVVEAADGAAPLVCPEVEERPDAGPASVGATDEPATPHETVSPTNAPAATSPDRRKIIGRG